MIVLRSIVILTLLLSVSNADTDANNTIRNKFNFIDQIHATLSEMVYDSSAQLDQTICDILGDVKTDTSTVETQPQLQLQTKTNPNCKPQAKTIKSKNNSFETIASDNNTSDNNVSEPKVESIDSFFQNQKYLDETENTFVRVRMDSYVQSQDSRINGYFQKIDSSSIKFKIRAQLPLSKSRKSLKIFIENVTLDEQASILKDESDEDRTVPDIGIHYFSLDNFGVDSRYSLGLSGVHPFVAGRFNMSINTNEWNIHPTQLFKYSTKDNFTEETNIYFDKQFKDLSLFRIQMQRGTKDEYDGMDYALSFQYYWNKNKDTGFRILQTFVGNTKYPYFVDKEAEIPQIKHYGGINDYISSFSWRKNIWRKWFYYEVNPSVNFHKDYDYKPNYAIRLYLDFYFGKFNN